MSNNVVTELAPTGTLRAAINLANFLLVSSRADNAAYLRDFVAEAKASGLIIELIARHQVDGLLVAS